MAKGYNFNYNESLICGRVTADPNYTKYEDSGNRRMIFTVASNRSTYGEDGERRDETLFIDVVAWNGLVDGLQKFLRRGSEIMVWGHLSSIRKSGYNLIRLVAERWLPGPSYNDDVANQGGTEHTSVATESSPLVVDEESGELSYNK